MAIEKLKRELKQNANDAVPAQQITDYLIQKCKDDKDFSEKILDENKNLKGCFDFVYKKVKEKLNSRNGWIDDQEVYDMAEEYFTGEKVKRVKTTNKSEESEKNNEIDEKDKKIKELEERIKSIQENNKQETLEKSKKETKKKVSKDKNIEGQMSFL